MQLEQLVELDLQGQPEQWVTQGQTGHLEPLEIQEIQDLTVELEQLDYQARLVLLVQMEKLD